MGGPGVRIEHPFSIHQNCNQMGKAMRGCSQIHAATLISCLLGTGGLSYTTGEGASELLLLRKGGGVAEKSFSQAEWGGGGGLGEF